MEVRSLLVSDVDNTLLGDDQALALFARWYEPRRDWLKLVYASGRFCDSLEASVRTSSLPRPAAYIGGVGTEINILDESLSAGPWPPDARGFDPDAIRSCLREDDRLRPQPDDLQSNFKVSYFADQLSTDDCALLKSKLRQMGQRVELVYSSDRDLDILPLGTNKGRAAAHLVQAWGVPRDRVFVAGDSENDLALFHKGFRGIVVANACRELRSFRDETIFQSQFAFARGVLEGLQHWISKSLDRASAAAH